MLKPYTVTYTDVMYAETPAEAIAKVAESVNPSLIKTYARAKIASETKKLNSNQIYRKEYTV